MRNEEEYKKLKELLEYLVDGNCELEGVEVLSELVKRYWD